MINSLSAEFARFKMSILLEKETAGVSGQRSDLTIAQLGAINEFQSAASSYYNGATISINRRVARGTYVRLSYTYAHAIDDGHLGDLHVLHRERLAMVRLAKRLAVKRVVEDLLDLSGKGHLRLQPGSIQFLSDQLVFP